MAVRRGSRRRSFKTVGKRISRLARFVTKRGLHGIQTKHRRDRARRGVARARRCWRGRGRSPRGQEHGGTGNNHGDAVGWASSPEETARCGEPIAAFQRVNRNINVQYAPISGDYDAAMLARFASRRPPDVFYVDSLDVPDYQPALEPLNNVHPAERFKLAPFYKRLLDGFTVRGQVLRSAEGLVAARDGRQHGGAPAGGRDAVRRTGRSSRRRSSACARRTRCRAARPPASQPRLGSAPRVHLPERRGVAERGADAVGDRLGRERRRRSRPT